MLPTDPTNFYPPVGGWCAPRLPRAFTSMGTGRRTPPVHDLEEILGRARMLLLRGLRLLMPGRGSTQRQWSAECPRTGPVERPTPSTWSGTGLPALVAPQESSFSFDVPSGRSAPAGPLQDRRKTSGSDKTTTARWLRLVLFFSNTAEGTMIWTKPSFTDIRFGFEITMYALNR
jgi:coenzyme PQQ precursor peptide PqqA